MRISTRPLLMLALGAAAAPVSTEAPGRVTTSFDLDDPDAGGSIVSLAALPDGAVLAASPDGRDRMRLLRFRADGQLDRGFGGSARVEGGGGEVLIRSDGGMTVLTAFGSSASTFGTPALVRVDARGRPDAAFGGGDGRLKVPLRTASAAAATADGGMVVAGDARNRAGKSRLFAVARAAANGTLDTRFGDGGVAVPFGVKGTADAVAAQPDGKVLASGTIGTLAEPQEVLVRLTGDGQRDPSFGGGDGVVELPLTSVPADSVSFALDAQGRSLISGLGPEPDSGWRILRYGQDGQPDPAFGQAGVVELDDAFAEASLVPHPDGVLVMAKYGIEEAVRLLKLNERGQPDGAFGVGGTAVTPLPFGGGSIMEGQLSFPASGFRVNAVALRPDGSLLLAGSSGVSIGDRITSHEASELALAALRPDGRLDERFGGPGRPPALRMNVVRDGLAAVRRRGLRLRIAPRRRGAILVRARAGGRTIARGVLALRAARPTTHTVPLTAGGRRLLRARRLRVTARYVANDLAGNRTRGRVRATLRR
jgi:uncharacterized delta-60 repeat protein